MKLSYQELSTIKSALNQSLQVSTPIEKVLAVKKIIYRIDKELSLKRLVAKNMHEFNKLAKA